MGIFDDSLTRMRRFLRDPGGLIWSDEALMDYFNEAQLEIAQKTGVLERVEAHRYPPEFTYSYMFDWEREYCEGDIYQCLMQNQADGSVITSPWESAYWMDTCDSVDDGMRFTHPWESAYCDSADAVPVALHAKFHRMKFCAFDNQEITPVSQDELARQDRFYKTRTGKVTNYYRPDEEGNLMVPYPRPSTVVWQEYDYARILVGENLVANGDFSTDPDTSWEWGGGWTQVANKAVHSTGQISPMWQSIPMTSGKSYSTSFTVSDRTDGTIRLWLGNTAGSPRNTNGTFIQTIAANFAVGGNKIYLYPSTTFDGKIDRVRFDSDAGIVASSEEWLQETEAGVIIDYIDSSDALFMVYSAMPNDITETADESDFPAWMVRVIEHATMERAFGADTDGFIPSLRDYWKLRKEIGIKAIEKFRRLKLTDRDFTMGIPQKRGIYRHPTLGDHYPRQWP